MALFEKGKGSRKRSVTLKQIGALLTKEETDGPSEMLTGYCRLNSENAARAALMAESLSLISAGLRPVDDAARDIAALVPKESKTKEPQLPIRQDFYVYNEACGMMLTARRMAGKQMEEGSPQWNKAAKNGDFLPLALAQDDPFVIRVVVGGELDPAESEEWVARIDWHLNVKDGKLCITGGSVLVSEDFREEDSYFDQFIRQLEVPKGHYSVRLYSYIPGVNGTAALDHISGGYGKSEPLGQWFRRSRKGEPFPSWLSSWSIGDNSTDPGHEEEWEGKKIPEEKEDFIHFLAHLTPVKVAPKLGLSELPSDGWFGGAENARLPQRPPLGLGGISVKGHLQSSSPSWMFAQDAFKLCSDRVLTDVKDGVVTVPLTDAGLLYQLGWFASRLALPGLRITLPTETPLDLSADLPENVVAVQSGRVIDFAFSNSCEPAELLPVLVEITPALTKLPEGALLEICSAGAKMPCCNPDAAFQRYAGKILSGSWIIEQTYPPVGANRLQDALELARETRRDGKITVKNEAEGLKILKWAWDSFKCRLEENPATIQDGSLQLGKQDQPTLLFYGAAAFAVRFGEVWPVVDLREKRDTDDE